MLDYSKTYFLYSAFYATLLTMYAFFGICQLFYFGTIIGCVVIENVVSNKRPVKFEIKETGVLISEPGMNIK